MRDTHELVLLDLKQRGMISKTTAFEITGELLDAFHASYLRLSGTKGNQSAREAKYNRKLAALSFVKFKVDNGLSVPEGFVYVISNPAWPDRFKIGMSQNPKLRLSQYQTYSPLRDYKLHHWSFWTDRLAGEALVHSLHLSTKDHEWVEISERKLKSKLEEINEHCFIQG